MLGDDGDELDLETMEDALAALRVRKLYEEEEDAGSDHEEWLGRALITHFAEIRSLWPLLRRWLRIYDLQVASMKYGPNFPVMDPLSVRSCIVYNGRWVFLISILRQAVLVREELLVFMFRVWSLHASSSPLKCARTCTKPGSAARHSPCQRVWRVQ